MNNVCLSYAHAHNTIPRQLFSVDVATLRSTLKFGKLEKLWKNNIDLEHQRAAYKI